MSLLGRRLDADQGECPFCVFVNEQAGGRARNCHGYADFHFRKAEQLYGMCCVHFCCWLVPDEVVEKAEIDWIEFDLGPPAALMPALIRPLYRVDV